MKAIPTCNKCGAELNEANWYASRRKKNGHICKECDSKRTKQWRKENPEKTKAHVTRYRRTAGQRPFNENRKCSSFLGVHVAERVLSHVFKDVKRMPMNNPGYDVICNRDKLIDIKSACTRKDGAWLFTIKRNAVADFFLCLAFDNREDLNPLHTWLITGSMINHLKSASISPSTIDRWDAYRLDTSKINTCCNNMKVISSR